MRCQFIDNLWRRSCGLEELPTIADKPKKMPSLESLKRTEWVPEFEKFMRNRMIMGAMRYGLLSRTDFKGYNLPFEIIKRVKIYQENANLEYLVDIANLAMIEFYNGKADGLKMTALDDSVHVDCRG
jgi:hypothetical protein